MISLENSHYGDHQPGKISQPVVTSKEESLLMTMSPDNSLSLESLWELALDH